MLGGEYPPDGQPHVRLPPATEDEGTEDGSEGWSEGRTGGRARDSTEGRTGALAAVRAGSLYAMRPVKAAWCCRHVCGFRYVDDRRRLLT
ncbi:hypothetical protein GCM10023324_59980 [Streptomyces youssoufiensis]